MKKKFYIVYLLLFAAFTCSITSCINNESRKGNGTIVKKEIKIDEFNKIEIAGLFNVFITQGSEAKLEIETDENLIEFIDAKVRSKKLKIKEKKIVSSTKGINIYLTITTLDEITLSGYTSLISSDKLNFDKIAMEASGSSKIKMDINGVDMNTQLSGNSSVELYGNIFTADINASGSANIDALNLNVDDLKLEVSGSAVAKVNVISNFDVKASGSAQVEYQGTPDMKQEVSGTGTVTKIY